MWWQWSHTQPRGRPDIEPESLHVLVLCKETNIFHLIQFRVLRQRMSNRKNPNALKVKLTYQQQHEKQYTAPIPLVGVGALSKKTKHKRRMMPHLYPSFLPSVPAHCP